MLLLGKDALIPATIATLLTAVLLFAVGIVMLELGAGSHTARPLASVAKAARAVARNPLVAATVLGGAWSASGWTMPRGAAPAAGTARRRGRALRAGVDRRAARAAGTRWAAPPRR